MFVFMVCMLKSIHAFAAEYQTGRDEKKRAISGGVSRGLETHKPADGRPVVNDEIAQIEKFQVRDGEKQRLQKSARRFADLHRHFVEMPAEHENKRHGNEADSGVQTC